MRLVPESFVAARREGGQEQKALALGMGACCQPLGSGKVVVELGTTRTFVWHTS